MTQAINSLEQIEPGRSNDQGRAQVGAVGKRGRPLGSKNKCAENPVGTDRNTAARLIRLENVIRALRADDDALERRPELKI